ncbi:unnamed protein product [Effrenium voratum]|uniref:Uncharacterized protein n=1 Tax=Effrenium voratum TaxID=2562239 RepID=A0AA36JSA9_9DINO|nr:unnamed protein product [Effrenium voratum]
MDGAGPPGISPPEGVEWSNRWAELENGYACLELHRDKLQKEVEELRKSLHAKMQAPPEGLEAELRSKILEMQEEADLRLSEEVRKEEKIARLASELERQTLRLGEMSQAKFQLEYEKSRTESEVLPLTTARDRLQQEKEAKEQIIHDLRQELASARDEQEKLFREKFDLARELRRELEAAKSEASFQQKLATEATEAQFRERKLKEDLERKLKTAQEDAALERSALEEKCRLRQEQLDRTNECWKQTQAELNDSVEGLQAACQATEGAAEELKSLKAELEEQRRQYQGLKAEHEDFLRRRVPGAETGELPTGFESISELVRIAHTSREEALQERAAKEHLQQVLQDIEREIRQRYPVLMSQNQELHELRRQNGELREQNKIILQKAREYATYNRDAEARAQRSERSLRMLEGHAQDLTKQLAVLLYEKNRRENANLAASNLTFFSLSKEEDDKWPLSNVEEVVEQNVALRKALRHLEAKCEDVSSKVELEDREQQFEEELEKKSKELKELVSQLQEVQDALEEATHDRDAAVKKVKTLEAGIVPGNAPTSRGEAPQDDRELLRVKREREDLAERCQALQTQLSELRAAKAQAEKEESVGRARLEYERQLRRDLEESSKQLQREKKELTDRLNQQSKLAEDLREEKRHEEAKLRGTLSALKDVKAAQGNAESLLQAEELKIRELEKSQSLLLSEKQLLEREVANLQSRMSQERESLKQELQDDQYKKQEHLFSAMSRKSEEDFARLQATLLAARDSEALQAKKHAEEQLAKLEAKLALLERPRAKLGDVAAEACEDPGWRSRRRL